MSLERYLIGEIPLHEAASYFIRVKTGAALDTRTYDPPTVLRERFHKAAEEMGLETGPTDEGSVQPVDGGLASQIASMQAAEQEMQAAQEVGEAAFYREKARAAQEAAQAMQKQISELSQSTQSMQQQLDASQSQIQASVQHAQIAQQAALQNVMQAQEATSQAIGQAMADKQEVLRQKQLAAAMRMGVLDVKDRVMAQLANDPTEQLAQQLSAPPPSGGAPAQAMGQGGEQQGPAAAAEDAPVAGGGGPANEGTAEERPKSDSSKDDKADSKSEKGTKVEISTKESNAKFLAEAARRLPYALTGAMAGGLAGHAFSGSSNEGLKSKIQSLEAEEAQGGGSFGTSLSLAQAKARLAIGEAAAKHPRASAGVGAVLGALSLGSHGPDIVNNVQQGMKAHKDADKLETILRGMK